jgi:hypothetical protein
MEEILQEAKKKFPSLLMSLIGTLSLIAIPLISQSIAKPEYVLIWARLSLILFAISLYLLALILLQHKKFNIKPNFTGFKHAPDKQCWVHEITGQRICESCKVDGKLVPLSIFGDGWRCSIHKDIIVDYQGQRASHYIDFGNL